MSKFFLKDDGTVVKRRSNDSHVETRAGRPRVAVVHMQWSDGSITRNRFHIPGKSSHETIAAEHFENMKHAAKAFPKMHPHHPVKVIKSEEL